MLAPYIRQLLELKASAGIAAHRVKWILKEIDDFAVAESLQDPHITEAFIQKWRATRIVDCDRTLYAKYSVWSQLTRMMSRNGCPSFIPQMPNQPNSDFTPYIFTNEQVQSIFNHCDSYVLYDKRFGTALFSMPALFRLLYSTGLRVSEALSLRNEDIHIDEQIIIVHKTKNRSERIVPICKSLAEVLEDYQLYRQRLPVNGVEKDRALYFIKADGTGMTTGTVYCHFRKILARCGIPHIGKHAGPRVHDIRHTFAVHALIQLVRNGIDPYTGLPILSACLGHHSLWATEQYVRLTKVMYPEIEKMSSKINAFVYPKIVKNEYYD